MEEANLYSEKKIQDCTAEELLNNFAVNRYNRNYLQTLDVINAMFDYLKTQKIPDDVRLKLLNESFKQVKLKLAKPILNTSVKIKN